MGHAIPHVWRLFQTWGNLSKLEKNDELLEDVKAKKLDSNEMAGGKFIMMIMIMIK